jgi:hypothetical protein
MSQNVKNLMNGCGINFDVRRKIPASAGNGGSIDLSADHQMAVIRQPISLGKSARLGVFVWPPAFTDNRASTPESQSKKC